MMDIRRPEKKEVGTRYNDCHTLLALFYEVNIERKACKINDLGRDIIGRRGAY